MEHITLYFRQGSSDKVYRASIEPADGGHVVRFAYGRRGTTLQTGTKTNTPVSHDEAKRIFDKIVGEKTAKGYSSGPDGTPYEGTDKAGQHTGVHCQLLNAIAESDVERLIADPAWWMQEKFDGRRLLLDKRGERIIGINRLGLAVALPAPLAADAANCDLDMILDGEAIGDTLHVFDVQLIGDDEICGLRHTERYLRLLNLLGSFQHPNIQLVHAAHNPDEKREWFDRFKQHGSEGVVFKHTDAPYIAGRPASGGTQLKYKFCETASFVVGKVNARRSVALVLLDGEETKPAGNVTIPPNHDIPQAGQVVECRYLYAFRESGSIYQPVYLGVRDDMAAAECTTTQLKYKAEA